MLLNESSVSTICPVEIETNEGITRHCVGSAMAPSELERRELSWCCWPGGTSGMVIGRLLLAWLRNRARGYQRQQRWSSSTFWLLMGLYRVSGRFQQIWDSVLKVPLWKKVNPQPDRMKTGLICKHDRGMVLYVCQWWNLRNRRNGLVSALGLLPWFFFIISQ